VPVLPLSTYYYSVFQQASGSIVDARPAPRPLHRERLFTFSCREEEPREVRRP